MSPRAERREEAAAARRWRGVRAGHVVLAAALLGGCPRKEPPAAPPPDAGAVALAEAGAEPDDGSALAALEPFDAWAPARVAIALDVDWENRYADAPRFTYSWPGLPALSLDGQRVVVAAAEPVRSNDPSLRLVTLRVDDREESSTMLQATREYRETMYPPYVDYPSPGVTDPLFRKLIKDIDRRIASANASLASHRPIPQCKLEREGDAGVRVAATCAGLRVTLEQHHLTVIGRAGHVRLDRSVAAWKSDPTGLPPGYETTQELRAMYGSADLGIVVVQLDRVAARSYGQGFARWHVVKLGP